MKLELPYRTENEVSIRFQKSLKQGEAHLVEMILEVDFKFDLRVHGKLGKLVGGIPNTENQGRNNLFPISASVRSDLLRALINKSFAIQYHIEGNRRGNSPTPYQLGLMCETIRQYLSDERHELAMMIDTQVEPLKNWDRTNVDKKIRRYTEGDL